MTYHGNVTVGGTPDVRELADLIITKVAVGPMNNNAYLLRCRHDDSQVLIDAANDTDALLQAVGDGGLTQVVTTHRHRDHWQSLADVVRLTGAETIAGEDDADALPVDVTTRVSHGDQIPVGSCRLEVIHLVGHTPGSIALLYDDPDGPPHLFTGDSLFPGGVGRTDSSGAFSTLIDHVETRVFDRLPDETWVYPGHGDDTTLGAERPQLGEWRARGW
ncbi:MAG TPA: MBL fold metallo-hydrolase [Nocardioidaceae bacterium]|nr:MBL fold metallo-hydrolase [Nocardioidaceae bacterium]